MVENIVFFLLYKKVFLFLFFYFCGGYPAQVQNIKLIRDRVTGYPVGYGFVEFSDHEAARRVS